MQAYKRKITYFYQFENGRIGTTVGFLKLEIRGEGVKIIINIQEPAGLPYKSGDLYFYHEAGNHLRAVKADVIKSIDGVLTYQARKDWRHFYDTERDLYTFDGALVVYNKNHYYVGDFWDKDRTGIPVEFVEPEEKREVKQEIKKEKPIPDCEDCPYQKKRVERNGDTDAFNKMLEEYPKLAVYGATELFQCVRIHPKDIGRLDMSNWKLGVNSFLTHGFFTYQYLLLGKMRFGDGKEQPIIGVPGVYSNREKYLANMFGFEQFVPVQKTGTKTGEFGYWIVNLNNG